jgi:hypothetical protein
MKSELIRDIENSLKIHGQPNVPGIQTWPKLFEHTSEHWETIKKSFIESCKEKPNFIRAWAYIQRPGVEDAKYPGWHTHGEEREGGRCFQCGVMYLDRFAHGTMFKRGEKEIVGDATPFVWHMFSPSDVHSPPRWDPNSNVTRYTIAAEALNIKDSV